MSAYTIRLACKNLENTLSVILENRRHFKTTKATKSFCSNSALNFFNQFNFASEGENGRRYIKIVASCDTLQ